MALRYLGSIPRLPHSISNDPAALSLRYAPEGGRRSVHITDDRARAFVSIGFFGPNKWGDQVPGVNPLHDARALTLLDAVINNRLYLELREKRGLLYSCGFEMDMPTHLASGFCLVGLAPLVDKIDETIECALEQLRSIKAKRISQAELDEAKKPLVEFKRTQLHENTSWLYLLQLTQRQPYGFALMHEIPEYYEALTLEDLYDVVDRHIHLDRLWIGVGTSAPDTPSTSDAANE